MKWQITLLDRIPANTVVHWPGIDILPNPDRAAYWCEIYGRLNACGSYFSTTTVISNNPKEITCQRCLCLHLGMLAKFKREAA